jgi:hypothetical protein
MLFYYITYLWKNGLPIGKNPQGDADQLPTAYKIIQDPYKKHISIEKYSQGAFSHVVYDSQFLDFRNLNPRQQKAWSKQIIHKTPNKITHLIRDINDRTLYIEENMFEDSLCLQCRVTTPHGFPLGINRMFYQERGDRFNGAVFFDPENNPVVIKKYTMENQTFLELIQEEWDMNHANNYL